MVDVGELGEGFGAAAEPAEVDGVVEREDDGCAEEFPEDGP